VRKNSSVTLMKLPKEVVQRLYDDPVYFAEVFMKWKPFVYQKALLRCKKRRIVAVWGRQSGKTTTICVKVIHYTFTRRNVTVLIVSKGLRQSLIMFSAISNFILGNPYLRQSVIRHTRTQIFLKNGSRILALPCSQDGANLRGHTCNIAIIDEAAFVNEIVINQVIFPMLATTNGTMVMISTPWGRQHIFYRSFTNPRYWTQRVKSEECPLISEEFLKEQRDAIGELRYQLEYEAQFIEDQNAFFPQDLIRRCVTLWDDNKHRMYTDTQIQAATAPYAGSYFLGLDIGKRIDHSVLAIFKRENYTLRIDQKNVHLNNVNRLVYLKQYPLRTAIMKTVVKDAIRLNKTFKFEAGCIDETQVGQAVVEEINDIVPTVQGVWLSAQKKQEVMMWFYTQMEQDKVALPFNKALISQMNEQMYYYGHVKEKIDQVEKGVMLFKHPEGRHDDQLWACALGVFATKERTYEAKVY